MHEEWTDRFYSVVLSRPISTCCVIWYESTILNYKSASFITNMNVFTECRHCCDASARYGLLTTQVSTSTEAFLLRTWYYSALKWAEGEVVTRVISLI